MKTKNFIVDENGVKYNIRDIKRVELVKTKYFSQDIKPFIRVKKGSVIRRLFRKDIHFSEDGFKLDSVCNGRYGGWYNKYYYSVKDFVDAMKSYWGKMPGGGYYSHIPVAEYTAAFWISPNAECIEYDAVKNCVKVKPHVIIYFDENTVESFTWLGHKGPRKIVKVFDTDIEAKNFYYEFR